MNALELFLDAHARVHSSAVAETRSSVDRILGDLPDDAMRARPAKGVNSIAWLVWHMARTEDATVNLVVVAGRQVLDDGWAERLGVDRRDIGTGMTGDEVADLGARVDLEATRAYRDAVGRRTREVVRSLASRAWDEIVGPADVARASAADAIGMRADWLVEFWQGHSRAARLATAAVVHNALHLGEADTIRTLLGLGGGR